MHRAATWRRRTLLRLAGTAGRATRITIRTGPGVLGAGLVTLAAGMVALPLGLVVGGLFLLVLDHRTPG